MPVRFLLNPGNRHAELIARLNALPAVKKVHSITDFLPADQAAKLAELHPLRDVIPGAVNSGSDVGDVVRSRMLASIATQHEGIVAGEGCACTSDGIGKALERRNCGVSTKTTKVNADARQKLETQLFVGLPVMLADINRLATTSTVSVDALQTSLRERFVAPDGRWRLEVVPAKQHAQLGQPEGIRHRHAVGGPAGGRGRLWILQAPRTRLPAP